GKTVLMDLFFAAAPVERKRRVSFRSFMRELRQRIARHGSLEDPGAVAAVAKEVAREATLLCFDKFAVTDTADALIVNRIFKKLFERGVVVVATANETPDELYKGGAERERFLPFIALLKEKLEIHELEGGHDYRRRKVARAAIAEAAAALETAPLEMAPPGLAAVEAEPESARAAAPGEAAGPTPLSTLDALAIATA